MKIIRRGATANHGQSSVDLGNSSFRWDSRLSSLLIKANYVRNFSGASRHNYEVQISFEEIKEILTTLSDAAIQFPEIFEAQLQPSIKAILRIQAILTGIKL